MSTHSILTLAVAVTVLAAPLRAAESAERPGYGTVQQAYDAFRKAREADDWKAFFSLVAPQEQDGLLLTTVMVVGQSGDDGLRKICDKHGVDWRPYAGKSTEELNELLPKFPKLAERLGATIANKAEFYSEVTKYGRREDDATPMKFLELRSLVEEGSTATVVAVTERTVITKAFDKQGKVTQEVPYRYQGISTYRFRKIDGRWFFGG